MKEIIAVGLVLLINLSNVTSFASFTMVNDGEKECKRKESTRLKKERRTSNKAV